MPDDLVADEEADDRAADEDADDRAADGAADGRLLAPAGAVADAGGADAVEQTP